MVKTQHTGREGGGGKKRDQSIQSTLKCTGVAAATESSSAFGEVSVCVHMYQCVRRSEYSIKCATAYICEPVCVCVCVRVQIHMGKGNVRAKDGAREHCPPGRE